MGMPAARAGDMHVCPAFDGPVPHVGGPILPPGCPTVLIGAMPAARVGDMASCVGPPDTIPSARSSPSSAANPRPASAIFAAIAERLPPAARPCRSAKPVTRPG